MLLLLVLTSCRGERVRVFGDTDAGVVTTCDDAFALGEAGVACAALTGDCTRRVDCCDRSAVCESGVLFFVNDNCGACGACETDLQCPRGQWCVGARCMPCVSGAPISCEGALAPFDRNGCDVPECLPVSECDRDEDCGSGRCVRGGACVGTFFNTCANVCVPADCTASEPAPQGCVAPCGPAVVGCASGFCIREGCRCEASSWSCNETCHTATRSTCDP